MALHTHWHNLYSFLITLPVRCSAWPAVYPFKEKPLFDYAAPLALVNPGHRNNA